jgi:hypothetical protein
MQLFDPLSDDLAQPAQSDWDASDRRAWIANGVVCSVIIGLADGSLLSAAAWFTGTLVRAYHGMPSIARAARRWSDSRKSFYLDVALGWSLYPGPLVGSFFGAMAPVIWNLPISSLQSAVLGLVLGPVIAAAEGVALASLVLGVVWIYTRRRKHA